MCDNHLKIKIYCLLAAAVLAYPGAVVAGTWATKAPMPTYRGSAHMGAIGGKLYVAGGTDAGALTTLEVYDPATNTWSAAAPMPAPRYQGGAGVIDGKLYVVGGWDAPISYIPKNTLLIYDAATDTWNFGASIPPGASPPSGLSGDSAVGVIDGKLYVLTSENGYSGYVKSFYVYDPARIVGAQGHSPARSTVTPMAVSSTGNSTLPGDPSRTELPGTMRRGFV